MNYSIGMTAKTKRELDKERLEFLEESGFRVVVVWENDWKINRDLEKIKILREVYNEENY